MSSNDSHIVKRSIGDAVVVDDLGSPAPKRARGPTADPALAVYGDEKLATLRAGFAAQNPYAGRLDKAVEWKIGPGIGNGIRLALLDKATGKPARITGPFAQYTVFIGNDDPTSTMKARLLQQVEPERFEALVSGAEDYDTMTDIEKFSVDMWTIFGRMLSEAICAEGTIATMVGSNKMPPKLKKKNADPAELFTADLERDGGRPACFSNVVSKTGVAFGLYLAAKPGSTEPAEPASGVAAALEDRAPTCHLKGWCDANPTEMIKSNVFTTPSNPTGLPMSTLASAAMIPHKGGFMKIDAVPHFSGISYGYSPKGNLFTPTVYAGRQGIRVFSVSPPGAGASESISANEQAVYDSVANPEDIYAAAGCN